MSDLSCQGMITDICDVIKNGDRITILVPNGTGRDGPAYKEKTGRAVMRGPYGWVLNMGGQVWHVRYCK